MKYVFYNHKKYEVKEAPYQYTCQFCDLQKRCAKGFDDTNLIPCKKLGLYQYLKEIKEEVK